MNPNQLWGKNMSCLGFRTILLQQKKHFVFPQGLEPLWSYVTMSLSKGVDLYTVEGESITMSDRRMTTTAISTMLHYYYKMLGSKNTVEGFLLPQVRRLVFNLRTPYRDAQIHRLSVYLFLYKFSVWLGPAAVLPNDPLSVSLESPVIHFVCCTVCMSKCLH